MLRFLIAPAAALWAVSAQAQDEISAMIAADGLGATEAVLASKLDPTPTELFALGGVRFLGAVEETLQTRWRMGMSGRTINLPVLRLEVAENPNPESFDPKVIEQIFGRVVLRMGDAEEALNPIGDADDIALRLNLGDLWFDVNMNGARDTGEGVMELAAGTIVPRRFGAQATGTAPTVRFDLADAAWLQAYTHLLSALGEMVLAYPPAEAIQTVMASTARLKEIRGDAPPVNAFDYEFADEVDLASMVYFALQQQPDAARTRSARLHLLEMIRLNRIFWTRVEAETDNDAEWIPNARQTSALGVVLPPEAAETWQALLADAEDLLEGRKLIPYWRLQSAGGINLKRLLDDPVPINAVEWIQGLGLLPYLERGERVSAFNWRQFQFLMRGDSMLFALLLN